MTRYLCGHPQHARRVNVTSLVLAERDEEPEYIYVATRSTVIARVIALAETPKPDDRASIVRILTGTDSVDDEQRVLILPRRSEETPFGLYDAATLATLVPTVEDLRLLDQATHPAVVQEGEVVFSLLGGNSDVATICRDAAASPADTLVAVLPIGSQDEAIGIYPVNALTIALAEADRDAAALELAVGSVEVDRRAGRRLEPDPWKVVIDCPMPEGDPPSTHQTAFAGPAGPQPAEVIGQPASGRDIALERSVEEDLAPRKSIERLDRQLRFVLGGIALITTLLTGVAWLTGNVTHAIPARGAFVIAFGLTAAAVIAAVIGLVAGARRQGNLNDLFQVRRIYEGRISVMARAVIVATVLYMAALAFAVVPAVRSASSDAGVAPPVAITFDSATLPTTVRIVASVDGLPAGSSRTLIIRGFASNDQPTDETSPDQGDVLIRQSGGASASGTASFDVTMPVPAGLALLTAEIVAPGERSGGCTPPASHPGCTSIKVPGSSSTSGSSFAAPSVTLEPGKGNKPATVTLTATIDGLGTGGSAILIVKAYTDPKDAAPDVVLRQAVSAGPTGTALIASTALIPVGSGWMTAQIYGAESIPGSCAPADKDPIHPGCVIVLIPS